MPIIGILASGVVSFNNPSFLVFGSGAATNAWSSTDGITWDYRQVYYATNGTNELFWSGIINSKLYTVDGNDGFVYSSTDGIAWDAEKWPISPATSGVDGLSYYNGKWLVAYNSKVYSSTDAVTWVGSSFNATPASPVFYDGTGTYAVAAGTGVYTSTDLTTWTARTVSAALTSAEQLIHGGSLWITTGDDNVTPAQRIYSSTNAITWTTRYTVTTYGDLSFTPFSLSYGNGVYLAGSNVNNRLYYSTNGTSWTTRTVTGATWVNVGYANGYHFAFSGTLRVIAYSTDAVTWTSRTVSAAESATEFNSIQYFNSNYYLFGAWDTVDLTPVYTSTDLVTWSPVTDSNSQLGIRTADGLRSAVKANNKYYFVGVTGYIVESNNDFTSWTVRTGAFSTNVINGITYGLSTFVAVGQSGNLQTSTDGVTWTSRTSTFGTSAINKVEFGNSTFVAVGAAGQARTSTDGITWTTRTSGFGTSAIINVRYVNNNFITMGESGIVGNSTDGITWTTRRPNANTTNSLDIAYGAGVYVLGKEDNIVYTSTDLTTWTTRTSALPDATSDITTMLFSNNIFVALGDLTARDYEFALYQTSTDGITWTSRTLGQAGSGSVAALRFGSVTAAGQGIAL